MSNFPEQPGFDSDASPRAGAQRSSNRRRARRAASRPRRFSTSTSPRATPSRCRSRCRISSAAHRPRPTPRATSPRSSPAISSAADCSRRSIRRPIIEKIVNVDAVPRFPDWRTINAQALVAGRITRQTDGRLKAEFRLWDVYRRPAARRPAILHHARQLAAHRPHHLRRDLRAADRRQGLLRHPHRVRRRDRPARSSASSGSPSWTRTAPTCAI